MKNALAVIVFLSVFSDVKAQTFHIELWRENARSMNVDALEQALNKTKNDSLRSIILSELALQYAFRQPEKGLIFSEQSLSLANSINYEEGIAEAQQSEAYCHWAMGNYSRALQSAFYSLRQFEKVKDSGGIAWMYLTISIFYRDVTDYDRAIENARIGLRLYDSLQKSKRIPYAIVASILEKQDQLDAAVEYVRQSSHLDSIENQSKWGWLLLLLGNIHAKKNNYDSALANYEKALPLIIAAQIPKDIVDLKVALANLYLKKGMLDASISHANEVLQQWSSTSYKKGVLETYDILVTAYRLKKQNDSILKYLDSSAALHNKLFNQEKEREIQNLAFSESQRLQQVVDQQRRLQNNIKFYSLIAALAVFLLIVFLLYRNNRHKQKAYVLLQQQKQETDNQKVKAENTLKDLRATQAQLIQSEKMASLGELTAGIAHEIQNPLNFVNNFSEVNTELLSELKDSLATKLSGVDRKESEAIINDLNQNLEKINRHGKRADSIVKGMLQHSKASTGLTELTDLNSLADEYIRLSYHGMRAKDKTFNAEIQTDFDASIGKINIVPQDIGRVLLNLYNNAFYAIGERFKVNGLGYKPAISITTRKVDARPEDPVGRGKINITVRDNGTGIPEKIKDKIFQPFFTTKPTGQGTGLGLSLSYDIVKAHGGEISVESKEGQGSEFVVQLPV